MIPTLALGLTDFIDVGGVHVTVPLLAIFAVGGSILMERLAYFGWNPLDLILPALRHQRASARQRFGMAFELHLIQQDDESRSNLGLQLEGAPQAIRGFVAPLLAGPGLRPGALARLRIDASERLSRRELKRCLGLLATLSVTALLLALLAGVSDLGRMCGEVAVHGTHVVPVGSRGLNQTLVASQAALLVAGVMLCISFGLMRLASTLEQELCWASSQWKLALRERDQRPEDSP